VRVLIRIAILNSCAKSNVHDLLYLFSLSLRNQSRLRPGVIKINYKIFGKIWSNPLAGADGYYINGHVLSALLSVDF